MTGVKSKVKMCRVCKQYKNKDQILSDTLVCVDCDKQTKLCNCGCNEQIRMYAQGGVIRKFKNRAHSAYYNRKGKKTSEETKRKISIVVSKRFEDPEIRRKHSEIRKGRKHTKDTIEKMRISANKRYEDPKEHIKSSAGQRNRYNDQTAKEITRQAMLKRYEDPKEHELTSIAIRNWFKENNITLEGANNPNWKGGIQYEPYDDKFNDEFKEIIRVRQDHICADMHIGNCSIDGKALHIHHIDMNKLNTTYENCIALCNSHHMHSHNDNARYRHREYNKKYTCQTYK